MGRCSDNNIRLATIRQLVPIHHRQIHKSQQEDPVGPLEGVVLGDQTAEEELRVDVVQGVVVLLGQLPFKHFYIIIYIPKTLLYRIESAPHLTPNSQPFLALFYGTSLFGLLSNRS